MLKLYVLLLNLVVFVDYNVVFCINPKNIDLVTPLRSQGEACGYESCPRIDNDRVNVHIVPHTHAELGRSKTFIEYYHGYDEVYGDKTRISMKRTLDAIIAQLWKDGNRKFAFADMSYFFNWWVNRDGTVHRMVYELLRQGRLFFIGGGWSISDEATTNYQTVIDQYTYTLRKINDSFLECGRPLVAWQSESMGHSREFASLIAQMGFDGLFINPISYDDELRRMRDNEMEFLWRGNDDLGIESDIYTNKLFDGYWSPPGFCFSTACKDPLLVSSLLSNIRQRVSEFVNAAKFRQAPYYRTKHIMIMMGMRQGYYDAEMWFANIDKLINHVNDISFRQNEGVVLYYSSPACYLKAVKDSNTTLGTYQDDFFPYAHDKDTYFTGFYTSRPTLKYLVNVANSHLQMAKQLQLTANLIDFSPMFEKYKWIMGVIQDHTLITGAHTETVGAYYKDKLHLVMKEATWLTTLGFNYLRKSPPVYYYKCNLNESSCPNLNTEKAFMVIYNPLAWPVTMHVRIPISVGRRYVIYDPAGKEILKVDVEQSKDDWDYDNQTVETLQPTTSKNNKQQDRMQVDLTHKNNILGKEVPACLMPIPEPVLLIPGRNTLATVELVFIAEDIPPLGYRSYYSEHAEPYNPRYKREADFNENDDEKLYNEEITKKTPVFSRLKRDYNQTYTNSNNIITKEGQRPIQEDKLKNKDLLLTAQYTVESEENPVLYSNDTEDTSEILDLFVGNATSSSEEEESYELTETYKQLVPQNKDQNSFDNEISVTTVKTNNYNIPDKSKEEQPQQPRDENEIFENDDDDLHLSRKANEIIKKKGKSPKLFIVSMKKVNDTDDNDKSENILNSYLLNDNLNRTSPNDVNEETMTHQLNAQMESPSYISDVSDSISNMENEDLKHVGLDNEEALIQGGVANSYPIRPGNLEAVSEPPDDFVIFKDSNSIEVPFKVAKELQRATTISPIYDLETIFITTSPEHNTITTTLRAKERTRTISLNPNTGILAENNFNNEDLIVKAYKNVSTTAFSPNEKLISTKPVTTAIPERTKQDSIEEQDLIINLHFKYETTTVNFYPVETTKPSVNRISTSTTKRKSPEFPRESRESSKTKLTESTTSKLTRTPKMKLPQGPERETFSTKSLKRDSTKSPKSDSKQSPTRDSTKSPRGVSAKSPKINSTKSPRKVSTKSSRRYSTISPIRVSTKSPKRISTKSTRRDSTKSSRRDSKKSPRRVSAKSPQRNSTKSSRKISTKSSRRYSTISPRRVSTKSPKRNSTKSSRKYSTESPLRFSTKSPRRVSAKSPKRNSTKSSRKISTKFSRRYSTISPRRVSTKSPKRNSTKSSRKYSTESPLRLSTKSPRSDSKKSPRRVSTKPLNINLTKSPRRVSTNSSRRYSTKSPRRVSTKSPLSQLRRHGRDREKKRIKSTTVKASPMRTTPRTVKYMAINKQPTRARPVTTRPTRARPVTQRPTRVRPEAQRPTRARPVTENPTRARPVTQWPTRARPVTQRPTRARPVTQWPTRVRPVKKTMKRKGKVLGPPTSKVNITKQILSDDDDDDDEDEDDISGLILAELEESTMTSTTPVPTTSTEPPVNDTDTDDDEKETSPTEPPEEEDNDPPGLRRIYSKIDDPDIEDFNEDTMPPRRQKWVVDYIVTPKPLFPEAITKPPNITNINVTTPAPSDNYEFHEVDLNINVTGKNLTQLEMELRAKYLKEQQELNKKAREETRRAGEKEKAERIKELRRTYDYRRVTHDYIENQYMRVQLSRHTGKPVSITLKNNITMALDIQFYYYDSDDPKKLDRPDQRPPGAFIFRPLDPIPNIIKHGMKTKVFKNNLVQEVHTQFSDYASYVLRLYNNSVYLEVDWMVGPIPIDDDLGKEVFIRYTTDVENQGVFYTDANGRQTIKRIRDRRSSFVPFKKDPIAGNIYPVTSKISIEDTENNIRFSVFNDRPQGGTSLKDGEIDLFLHRRILTDDSGIFAFLNETQDGVGLMVRGKHLLYVSKLNKISTRIFEKKLQKQIHLPPQFFASSPNPYNRNFKSAWFIWLGLNNEFSALNSKLPLGVHLLTMEPVGKNQVLIRLENFLEKADLTTDGIKSVYLKDLFKHLKLEDLKETTLAANQWLENWAPIPWRKDRSFLRSFNEAYGNDSVPPVFADGPEHLKPVEYLSIDDEIVLKPQEIRTFICTYKYVPTKTLV